MLLKGLVVTGLLASTPFAFAVTQDPKPRPAGTSAESAVQAAQDQARRAEQDLAGMRRELDAARAELARMRDQLERALDQVDRQFEPQRDRNCSPSRSRALMSHWQWLRDEGHEKRADAVVARLVDDVGDDAHRLNNLAWHLMNDEETSGKYDSLALALAVRLQKQGDDLDPRFLDTIAMAKFLAGQVDSAVELQAKAIERGGRGDEFRRRLRTYRAAQDALAKAATPAAPKAAPVPATPVEVGASMVAASRE